MSNCFCLEFSFSKVAHYELSYVDCSGNTVTDTYQSGITYNICSEDFEPIVNCFDIDFEVKGLCINGECPGEYFQLKNECDVVTIFPLGVNCVVQNPTSNGSYDGIASLFISGGTPPYIINWENGNYSQTLTNLGSGQYNAVVTDFYGDFTANTTCVLLAPSPTPTMTPTPTPTPTPIVNNLCLIVKRKIGKITFTDLYDFTYNGFYNGFPTWTSSPPNYDIVWMSGSSQ